MNINQIIQEERTKMLNEGWFSDIANTIYDLTAPEDVPVSGYIPHETEIGQDKAKEMMKHGSQPWEYEEETEDVREEAEAAAAIAALLGVRLIPIPTEPAQAPKYGEPAEWARETKIPQTPKKPWLPHQRITAPPGHPQHWPKHQRPLTPTDPGKGMRPMTRQEKIRWDLENLPPFGRHGPLPGTPINESQQRNLQEIIQEELTKMLNEEEDKKHYQLKTSEHEQVGPEINRFVSTTMQRGAKKPDFSQRSRFSGDMTSREREDVDTKTGVNKFTSDAGNTTFVRSVGSETALASQPWEGTTDIEDIEQKPVSQFGAKKGTQSWWQSKVNPQKTTKHSAARFIQPVKQYGGKHGTAFSQTVSESQLNQAIQEELTKMLNEEASSLPSLSKQLGKGPTGASEQWKSHMSNKATPDKWVDTQTVMQRGNIPAPDEKRRIQAKSASKDIRTTKTDKSGKTRDTQDVTISDETSTPDAEAKLQYKPWEGETHKLTTDPKTGKTIKKGARFIQPGQTEYGQLGPTGRLVSEHKLNQIIQEELTKMLNEESYSAQGDKAKTAYQSKHFERSKVNIPKGGKRSEDYRETTMHRGTHPGSKPAPRGSVMKPFSSRDAVSTTTDGEEEYEETTTAGYDSGTKGADAALEFQPWKGTHLTYKDEVQKAPKTEFYSDWNPWKTKPKTISKPVETGFIEPATTRFGQLGTARQVSEHKLNQAIQEELTKMLNEEIQQEELPVIYRIQGFIDFLNSRDAKLVGPDEVMWRQDPRYPATKTTLRVAWQAYKKEKFNL